MVLVNMQTIVGRELLAGAEGDDEKGYWLGQQTPDTVLAAFNGVAMWADPDEVINPLQLTDVLLIWLQARVVWHVRYFPKPAEGEEGISLWWGVVFGAGHFTKHADPALLSAVREFRKKKKSSKCPPSPTPEADSDDVPVEQLGRLNAKPYHDELTTAEVTHQSLASMATAIEAIRAST